jgi:two-component sensor histidine kinase/PAS domain-containing protein
MKNLPEWVRDVVNDPARLRAIACHVPRSTENDPDFRMITELAASLFNAPIALVTIIDMDRQWFKARVGTAETGTPVSVSFCAHTIANAGAGPMVLTDLVGDPRFSTNPLVTDDPRIRFYAGAPILVGGQAVGTVCVLDIVERPDISAQATANLVRLAAIAGSLFEFKDGTRRGEVAETSRLRTEHRHRLALAVADIATWDLDVKTGTVSGDDNLAEMFGLERSGIISMDEFLSAIEPMDRSLVETSLKQAFETGSEFMAEFQIAGEERWLLGLGQVFERDEHGEATRAIGVNIDVTEKKKQESHARFMLREINHRVKNTLAILQSLAAQTLRRSSSAEDFMIAFSGRLQAISAAHTLLSDHDWGNISLRNLIVLQVKPYLAEEPDGIVIDGPDIDLDPDEALGLGLIFHELATNARKYGALSVPGGRVTIDISVNEGPDPAYVTVHWQEKGGPPVSKPSSKGFGSILIERSLDKVMGSVVSVDFPPLGFQALLEIPSKSRQQPGGAKS